jgi:hypothetical protein
MLNNIRMFYFSMLNNYFSIFSFIKWQIKILHPWLMSWQDLLIPQEIIVHQEHEYEYVYANDRTFGLQPRSHKYEIPQSTKYEYPEQPQSHQYEYPSIGALQLQNGKSKNVKELRDPKDSAKLIWQMIIKIQYVDSHND